MFVLFFELAAQYTRRRLGAVLAIEPFVVVLLTLDFLLHLAGALFDSLALLSAACGRPTLGPALSSKSHVERPVRTNNSV